MEQKIVLSHYSLQHVESVLNKYLRQTCNSLFDLVPSGAKKLGGRLITNFTNWFSSVVSDMETAKSPWEQHDKRFYNSLFLMAFHNVQEEIISKGLFSNHLIELENLQDFIGMLTASPYLYMSSLNDLKTFLNKDEVAQIDALQHTFLEKLSSQQSFLMQCLNADILYLLKDWCENKISVNTVINYLLFYQSAFHPATNYIILCGLKSFLISKKDNFLTSVGEAELIQFERFLVAKTKEFSRFRHIPVNSKEENQNLYSASNPQTKSENLFTVNGFISVLSYMLQHPFQTLLFGLAAQVAAAAAFDPIRQATERNSLTREKRISTNGIANEFVINSGTGNHTDPAITTKGSEFSILFAASDGSGYGIFSVSCDSYARCSAQVPLNTITANDQRSPSVIFQNNEYRCFWQSYSSSTLNDIMYRRFDASWQPIGSETTFSTTNTAFADQTLPRVAASTSGAVVVWMSDNFDGSGFGVGLRFMQLNGTPIGSDVVANKYVTQGQRYPAVAATNNNSLIVWESDPSPGDAGTIGIRANFAYPNNTVGASDFLVNRMTTTGNQRFPDVASDGSSLYLVVYDSVGDIFGTFVTGPSQFSGNDFPISQTSGIQTQPKVVYKDNGNFLVLFKSDPTNSGVFDIYGREVTSSGQLVGSETKINTVANNQLNPTAAAFRSGDWKDYATIWENVVSGGTTNVELRVFNNSAPPVATTQAVTTGIVTTGPATTGLPATTGTTMQGTTVATTDTQTSQTATTSVYPTTNPGTTQGPVTSGTTNVVTTASTAELTTASPLVSTTGMILKNFTLDTQAATQQNNSNPSSNSQTGLVAGLATVGAVATLLGIGGVSYGCKRHHDRKKQGEFGYGSRREINGLQLEERNRYSTTNSLNSSNYSNRVNKPASRVGDYFLLNKLNQSQVNKFYEMSGIEFTIIPGKKAVKYNQLGQGQFGKLKLAEHYETMDLAAVKKIKGKSVNSASQEVQVHKLVNNEENIIKLYAAENSIDSDGKPAIYMFMEFARYGNGAFLQKCLSRLSDTNKKDAILFDGFYQLLNGLSNMHKHGAYHCDMKPTNIVFDSKGTLKIIDFGNSIISPDSPMIKGCGDNRYYDDERYRNETFNGINCDVWAAFITFLEIALGRFPFDDTDYKTRFGTWDANYFHNKLKEIPELKNAKKGSFFAFINEYLKPDSRQLMDPNQLKTIIRQNYGHLLFKHANLREQVFKDLDNLSKSQQSPISIPVNEVPREKDENYQSDYNTPRRRLTAVTPMWRQSQGGIQSRRSDAMYGNEVVVDMPHNN